jgi:hypothetical protein
MVARPLPDDPIEPIVRRFREGNGERGLLAGSRC